MSTTLIAQDQSNNVTAIVASIVILLVLSVTLVIIGVVLIWGYRRKVAKQKLYTDSSYSTLSTRGTGQQVQPQHLQHDSAQLYDQIHLSPSTGQTEYIPKDENANINHQSATQQNSQPTYSTAGEGIAEHSSTLSAANQAISQKSPQKAHESTWSSEHSTYAAVDTSKKKFKKQRTREDPKHKAGEKGPPVNPYVRHEVPSVSMQDNATNQEIDTSHTIEEMYTAVKKKPKHYEPKGEEETPPIPPHTVEELYTAVQKKPKSTSNADGNKDSHNVPSHVMDWMHAAEEKLLQSPTKDLYTAVMDKSNDGSTDDIETAPPIPPHTVEELYTAIVKTPKGNAEDEKEAPPIPPYTIERN